MVVTVVLVVIGSVGIVVGAELFAEHLSVAAARLGVSSFALALLLAGAEPEELATAITASVRDAPGVAVGDVIGANVTICLVAIGAAACIAPVVFTRSSRRYAVGGLVIAGVVTTLVWDGRIGRLGGVALVLLYVAFVVAIWILERQPPSLGEVGELEGARREVRQDKRPGRRVGRELVLSLFGIVLLGVGSVTIVEGVVRLTSAEDAQTALGLTLVGFATAAELVVLAWSSARRGMPETVVAAVVGSYTYNVTMTLGTAALARPLELDDPSLLRLPWLLMLGALALVIVLVRSRGVLRRPEGVVLVAAYPVFVLLVLAR